MSVCSTNIIGNINRLVGKYTIINAALTSDSTMEKAVNRSLLQVSRKWSMSQKNGPIMHLQFITLLGLQ